MKNRLTFETGVFNQLIKPTKTKKTTIIIIKIKVNPTASKI